MDAENPDTLMKGDGAVQRVGDWSRQINQVNHRVRNHVPGPALIHHLENEREHWTF